MCDTAGAGLNGVDNVWAIQKSMLRSNHADGWQVHIRVYIFAIAYAQIKYYWVKGIRLDRIKNVLNSLPNFK